MIRISFYVVDKNIDRFSSYLRRGASYFLLQSEIQFDGKRDLINMILYCLELVDKIAMLRE